MNGDVQPICALCQRANSRAQLHAHIAAQRESARRTIQLIKAYHPAWSEQDGVCSRCWKSYADASRALGLLSLQKPALLRPHRGVNFGAGRIRSKSLR